MEGMGTWALPSYNNEKRFRNRREGLKSQCLWTETFSSWESESSKDNSKVVPVHQYDLLPDSRLSPNPIPMVPNHHGVHPTGETCSRSDPLMLARLRPKGEGFTQGHISLIHSSICLMCIHGIQSICLALWTQKAKSRHHGAIILGAEKGLYPRSADS